MRAIRVTGESARANPKSSDSGCELETGVAPKSLMCRSRKTVVWVTGRTHHGKTHTSVRHRGLGDESGGGTRGASRTPSSAGGPARAAASHSGQWPAYNFTHFKAAGFETPDIPYGKWSQAERDAEAKRLMKEAGVADLTLRLIYNTSESHKQIATVATQMWNMGTNRARQCCALGEHLVIRASS